jgi:hypothetical protein
LWGVVRKGKGYRCLINAYCVPFGALQLHTFCNQSPSHAVLVLSPLRKVHVRVLQRGVFHTGLGSRVLGLGSAIVVNHVPDSFSGQTDPGFLRHFSNPSIRRELLFLLRVCRAGLQALFAGTFIHRRLAKRLQVDV